MNRGPKAGAVLPRHHETNMRKAWGDDAPVWMVMLARAADAWGLAETGRRVGYSGSAVSQAINAKYPGDMPALETAVRGCLLAEKVECPVLGSIGANVCRSTQRQPFNTISPLSVRLARACRGCAHRQGGAMPHSDPDAREGDPHA